MDASLVAAIVMTLAFAATNGLHDAADAIAALVATRAARPGTAVLLAAVGNIIGPLAFGHAVANTIAGIVTVPPGETIAVLGAALTAAVAWNLLTWRFGIPSSSGHALLGGLVGAAITRQGIHGVHWGGFTGARPDGVFGVMAVLALAPLFGFAAGFLIERGARRATARATRRLRGPVRAGQWLMSEGLSLSHGANDTQKSVGVVAVLLFVGGHTTRLAAPTWAILACAVTLTAGTTLGGWPIIKTLGQRLVPLRPIDALSSQTASTAVLAIASFAGAPVSTTEVVSGAIVGVGGGRRRWRHVRWPIVRAMLLAWLVTMPVAAALAAALSFPWRWFA